MYDASQGWETQTWPCDETGDTLTSDDPSIVQVTPLGTEEVHAINNTRPEAMKFALTGMKLGETTLSLKCRGEDSKFTVYVR